MEAIEVLERNWWALALRAAVAVAFGVFALTRPEIAFVVVVALFGGWMTVDGILAIAAASYAAERRVRWWPIAAEGITGIVIGAVLYLLPGINVLVLLYAVALWGVASGAFRVVAALRLRRILDGELLMALCGALSVLFGLLVAVSPQTGVLTLTSSVGMFAIVYGLLFAVLGARLYSFSRWHQSHPLGA